MEFGDYNESSSSNVKKGTVALRTLRKPKVGTLKMNIESKEHLDEQKIMLADDSGLEGLVVLINHEHPKISGLAAKTINLLSSNDDDEAVIIEEKGFDPLVEMAGYKDERVQGSSVMTIAMLAEQSECHDGIIASAGWKRIHSWLKSPLPEVKKGAIMLVGNLAMKTEQREAMKKEGTISLLASEMATTDIDLQKGLATAIANLVQTGTLAKEIATPERLKFVGNWLNSGDNEVIGGAVYILANVSSLDDHKIDVYNAGFLPLLLKLINSDDERISVGAAITISNLSSLLEKTEEMCDKLLEPLVQLSHKTKNPDLIYRIASTLSNLSQNQALKEKLKVKATESLKTMMENSDSEIQKEAASALVDLGEQVPIIETPQEEEKQEDNEEDKEEQIQEQLKQRIQELLNKLAGNDVQQIEQAAAVLAEMSLKKENRAVIRSCGGINIIVTLLLRDEKSLEKAQYDCVRIVSELSKSNKDRNKFKPNVVPPLVRLSKTTDPVSLLAVLECINQLAKSKVLLTAFKKEKMEETFVNASINKLNENLQVNALDLISLFALSDLNVQNAVLKIKNAVPNICKLLKDSPLPVRTSAIRALGALSSGTNRKVQQEVRKNKAIQLCCAYYKEKDDGILLATSNALSFIVDGNASNQNQVAKYGGVDGLANLALSQNQSLQQAVLQCTRACVKFNSKLQNLFRTKKVITPLVNLISSPNDVVKSFTSGALIELGRDNAKNSEAIALAGAIPLLVKELENPSDAVKYHCQGVLWCLAKDKKRKEAIKSTKAVEILQKQLKESTSDQVKKGAKWCIDRLK